MKLEFKLTVEFDESEINEASMSSAIDDEIEGIYNVPGVSHVYCREA
jgi:hypothetical protein